MEEAMRLGELAVKLEEYRYRILAALAWIVFGMVFGAATTLGYALVALGFGYWVFTPAMISAGIAAGYTYGMFWKYAPPYEVGKRDVALLIVPIAIAYVAVALLEQPAYFSIAWYPSLGVALLLYYGREKLRKKFGSAVAAGTAMIVTSPLPVAIASNEVAAGLLAVAMMMLIYFTTAVKTFFNAEKVLYA